MDEVFDQYYQSAGNIFAAEDTFWVGEEEVFPADQSAFAWHEEQNGRSPLRNRDKKNRVDEVFQYYQSPGNIFTTEDTFWVGEEVFPENQSAFVRHEEQNGRSPLQNREKKNRMDEVFRSAGNIFETEDIVWVGEEAFPANRSTFIRYEVGPGGGSGGKTLGAKRNYLNVNKRMIEFMRRRWNPVAEGGEYERERCRRHMINERMRREKQKNSYSSLRSLLPPRTKSDKNSIIQEAAKEVQELQRHREELERRNREIEGILAERERGKNEGAKIKLRVANPRSGVDSMVEVLKCLKNMGSKTGAIQSNFSAQEFSAVLGIESEKEAAEVEKAVQRSLFEVERKLPFHFPN
ncbi:transcription factor bHLH92 isoform X1 [Rhododendron vialii]|uniref:transcription factor bHLH92 isoform X1 n=1 Tax=Rhododendron vialii TaxID=182163 RepID=UPI00265FC713|nr:transcription factor bHLH92 isoform X1 [Rhododendron vialii]